MATKFGEGYYEIYPRINQAAVKAAREAITKSMGDTFAKESRRMRDEDNRTTNESVKNSRFRRTQEEARIAAMRKAENAAYKEEAGRERNRDRDRKNTYRDETLLGRLRNRNSKQNQKNTKDEESGAHKLAVAFRTIGTIVRGFTVATAFIDAFNTLRVAVGGIVAVLPIMNAALVATPSILASIGAEAIILKIAFRGVFSTIKDAFDPKRQKQYREELQRLAPAARTFVQEIVKLKDLKLPNLQQALFGNASIQQTGKQLAPFVQALAPAAKGVAAATGGAIGAVTSSLTSTKGITAFTFVLKDLAANLRNVTPGLKKFTDGFLQLIFHVSSLGQGQVGKAFGNWLGKIGDFVANINVADVFEKAKVAAKALQVVLKDVWDILTGIFSALNTKAAWDGFTGVIHEIADFVRSGTGKLFLTQLSNALATLSNLVGTLTGSALRFLAGMFAALYPAIKPLADIIKKIGKDLEPLGAVVGTILADAFKTLTSILVTLEPWIKKTVGWMYDHREEIGKVVGKILLLIAAYMALKKIGAIANPFIGIVQSLAALPIPVLVAIGLIAVLAAGIYVAYQNSQTFRNQVHDLKVHLEQLGKALGPLLGFFKEWGKLIGKIFLYTLIADMWLLNGVVFVLTQSIEGLKRAFDNMKHWILTGWDAVKNFFTVTVPGWFKYMNDQLNQAGNGIVKDFHKYWSAAINFFTGTVKNFFTKTVPSWFLKLRDWVVYAYDWIVRKTHERWSGIINFFTGTVKNFFTKTIPSWAASLRNQVAGVWDNMFHRASGFVNRIKNFFTGSFKDFFMKTIPSWFASLRNQVAGVWDNMFHRAAGFVGRIKDFFTKNIKDFFRKTIPEWAAWMGKAIADTWDRLWKWTFDKWKKIYNTIRDIVQGIINSVWNNGLAKAWNSVVKHVPLVGGHMTIDNKVQIPRMATGGHVTGPGGPRSDQIPAWLSNGEFVVNAASTAQHRALLEAINNGGKTGPLYASGGAVQAIEALQRSVGPGLRVTSTTGGGHAAHSYHYQGMAVDFAGSKRAMDAAAMNLMKFAGYILEMFHSPKWFVKNFRPSGPIDYATHFNHVHLAMSLAAAQQALKDKKAGKIRGFVGFGPGASSLDPFVKRLHEEGAMKQFDAAYKALRNVKGLGGDGDKIHYAIAKQPLDLAVTQVNEKVKEMADQAAAAAAFAGTQPSNLGAMVGKGRSWISQASKFANIPANWVSWLLYIMQHESNFNPNAVNRTDSNARAGHPSQGLMQLIPSTFNFYHARKTSNNIRDPIANIAAAVNYIHGKYGDVFHTPWAKHTGTYYKEGGLVPTLFDGGGKLPPHSMTLAANNSNNWEQVGGGFPSTVILDLGNDNTIELMMDSRIAKDQNDFIRYVTTR